VEAVQAVPVVQVVEVVPVAEAINIITDIVATMIIIMSMNMNTVPIPDLLVC